MRTIMLMMAGWLLCMAASAQKETRIYQFDKPLYGAAYYAEYTPTNRLDKDIRLMKEAHLTVVRGANRHGRYSSRRTDSLSSHGWTASSTHCTKLASRSCFHNLSISSRVNPVILQISVMS